MSSANSWTLKECRFIRLESGCMYRTNKIGPVEYHNEDLLSEKFGWQSLLTVFCLTNTNGTMIDMCRKFHTSKLACLGGCYDQLCQMLRTDQAVLIKIHVFCQDLKGYHLQF